jgi:hypothetical protein
LRDADLERGARIKRKHEASTSRPSCPARNREREILDHAARPQLVARRHFLRVAAQRAAPARGRMLPTRDGFQPPRRRPASP